MTNPPLKCHDTVLCTNGVDTYHDWNISHSGRCNKCGEEKQPTAEPKCELDHCHECAKCGYERPMTKGEAEIAKGLDELFEEDTPPVEPNDGLETGALTTNEEALAIVEDMRKKYEEANTPPVEGEWEEAVDKIGTENRPEWEKKLYAICNSEDYKDVKSFITTLLHSEREKERERIVKMIDGSNILKLLEVAKCPECDGSGAYYVGSNEDPDVQQCQWCDERKKAVSALSSLRDKLSNK